MAKVILFLNSYFSSVKILSAEQIRALDKYTIEHEPIASIDLMERAAGEIFQSIIQLAKGTRVYYVFCGMGNNGGDGLAVARMLVETGCQVYTYVVRHSPNASKDFELNQERLKNISGIHFIETELRIPKIAPDAIVIDAIFGSGLTRPVEGIAAMVINAINESRATVYSIDIPSGLFCDKPNEADDTIVHSNITFTFHAPKLSFLFAANGKYVPEFQVLDIGLIKEYEVQLASQSYYVIHDVVKSFFKKREKFSHKGTYGHALICAGSIGKIGAAVLAVRAALKSGAGLVSANIPACGYEIMQTTNPEAMVYKDESDEILTHVPDIERFSAIGVGPGIGTEKETVSYIKELLQKNHKPMVLDADALNIFSSDSSLLSLIFENSIITPHVGEFKRLVGEWKDDLDKLQKQLEFSKTNKVVVVLKGANTSISTSDGKVYFNSTGNPGMAKGGSGDVLTGIITSLLAQKYSPAEAAVIGVYIHGLAGDMAKGILGETSMEARDIIHYLPKAFKELEA